MNSSDATLIYAPLSPRRTAGSNHPLAIGWDGCIAQTILGVENLLDDIRVWVLCTTSLTTDARSGHMRRPVALAPLDSGFRRNDGGYAQHPYAFPTFEPLVVIRAISTEALLPSTVHGLQ